MLGQTERGLMLARNPTSPGFGTFVCSLNRQNISLDWHGCGGIEGRAVTPQPHLLLVDRERRCPQGMLPVPLQRADLHECKAEMQEGVFLHSHSCGQLPFDLVHLESAVSLLVL